MPLEKRYWKIGQTRFVDFRSRSASVSASASDAANGFSTTTLKPASSALPRLREMQRRGRADVDDVEVETQKLFEVAEDLRHAVLVGELLRPRLVEIAERLDTVAVAEALVALDVARADPGADDTDFERLRHAARSCGRLPPIRVACASARSASSIAMKQWLCFIAVSVRFNTSSRSCSP